MLAIQLAAAIEAVCPSQLDDMKSQVWRSYGQGHLTDDEAQSLADAIETRRGVRQQARPSAPSKPAGRRSIFPPRRPQHARLHPERIARRRRLAGSSPLPPQLRDEWTTGETAVLRIVSDEVCDSGTCDRSIAEIAARAGVCRSLAQATLRRAARAGLISIEERPQEKRKNLPNVLRIVSDEWMTWIKRGPKGHLIGSNKMDRTENLHLKRTNDSAQNTRSNGFGGKRTWDRPAVP